jgi:hypothetical protein
VLLCFPNPAGDRPDESQAPCGHSGTTARFGSSHTKLGPLPFRLCELAAPAPAGWILPRCRRASTGCDWLY